MPIIFTHNGIPFLSDTAGSGVIGVAGVVSGGAGATGGVGGTGVAGVTGGTGSVAGVSVGCCGSILLLSHQVTYSTLRV